MGRRSETKASPATGRPAARRGSGGRKKGSGALAGPSAAWGLRAAQAMADPSRWAVLREIAREPATVGDVARRVGLSPACTSRHLRILREVGLVCVTRRGRSLQCSWAAEDTRAAEWLRLAFGATPDSGPDWQPVKEGPEIALVSNSSRPGTPKRTWGQRNRDSEFDTYASSSSQARTTSPRKPSNDIDDYLL